MSAAAIFGLNGPVLSGAERDFFRAAAPWGFILFARNVESPEQLRRLAAGLREAAGHDAPVFIDQEGGRVQRLRAPLWSDWPAPLDLMEALGPGDGPRALALMMRLMAGELRAAGVDANCAPVADLAGPATHPFLRNRCLGTDPATAARAARAAAEALLAGGVLPVVKHIPGHGRATADSHVDTPVVAAPLEELEATDFAVFRALADLPAAMTCHVRFTALDPEAPATFSAPVIRHIRESLGFAGLLMSDDIGMGALSGRPGERAARALAAGCDVALHCSGLLAEMEEVAAAVPALCGPAAARAARAAAARRPPAPFDAAAAAEDFARLGLSPFAAAPAHA